MATQPPFKSRSLRPPYLQFWNCETSLNLGGVETMWALPHKHFWTIPPNHLTHLVTLDITTNLLLLNTLFLTALSFYLSFYVQPANKDQVLDVKLFLIILIQMKLFSRYDSFHRVLPKSFSLEASFHYLALFCTEIMYALPKFWSNQANLSEPI